MDIHAAKRLPLREVLAALGRSPADEKKGGLELWYSSPWREETKPSLKVDVARNQWYDHGGGFGGGVLELVMRARGVSVSGALGWLNANCSQGDLFGAPATRLVSEVASPPEFEGATVQPLRHPALLRYLSERGIRADLARDYVQEMHYTLAGKRYFALAFPNRSGGYELRNAYYKGGTGKKDISALSLPADLFGTRNPEQGTIVSVFEGFFDFLSALALELLPPGSTALVLNSVTNRAAALAYVRESGAEAVRLYLDTDAPGREATAYFHSSLAPLPVTDESGLYAAHPDLNDYLVSIRSQIAKVL